MCILVLMPIHIDWFQNPKCCICLEVSILPIHFLQDHCHLFMVSQSIISCCAVCWIWERGQHFVTPNLLRWSGFSWRGCRERSVEAKSFCRDLSILDGKTKFHYCFLWSFEKYAKWRISGWSLKGTAPVHIWENCCRSCFVWFWESGFQNERLAQFFGLEICFLWTCACNPPLQNVLLC